MTNIFESPWLLLAVSAFLLGAAAVIWQMRGRQGRWMFLLPVVTAAAAVGADWLVRTDAEQIQDLLDACRRAALAETAQGMEAYIASDYQDPVHRNKAELLAAAEEIFHRAGLEKVVERGHKLRIEGDTAHSRIRFRVHLSPQRSAYAVGGSLLFVVLEIDYRRDRRLGWQIRRVLLDSVNDTPMGWKDV
ncbi:MAG: hypothetical protein WHS88_05325 [Anaerohalosphaeraceae bacterium]